MDRISNKLDEITSKSPSFNSDLHLLLDELIAIFYTNTNIYPYLKVVDRVLVAACTGESSLLMAKCCQLVLLLETKKKLELSVDTVGQLTTRWASILASPDDVCYIDVLLALRILIGKYGESVVKVQFGGNTVASILVSNIESKCVLTDAEQVHRLRLACLGALTPFCGSVQLTALAPQLMDAVCAPPCPDSASHAKLYATMAGALQAVLLGGGWKGHWAEESVGRLLGIAAGGMLCSPPVRLSPSPAPPLPQQNNQPGTPGSSAKVKKWKRKKPNKVAYAKAESGKVEATEDTEASFAVTSDSEHSDSESGRLAKEKARAVMASASLLVNAVRCVEKKAVAGYYMAILGAFERWLDTGQRWSAKSTAAVCSALDSILLAARPYLAIAQQTGGSGAFTAYSENVACCLISLTKSVCRALNREPTAGLLAASATLVSVTPYSRLAPSETLLTQLLCSAISHNAGNSEWDKSLVKFISSILLVNPHTKEQLSLINSGPWGDHSSSESWITHFICSKFSGKTGADGAVWWEAVHAAWTGHFPSLGMTMLNQVRSRLASDLRTTESRTPAADALYALLVQAAAAEDDGAASATSWEWLGPTLMGLLADPTCGEAMPLVVCRTMRHITPRAYFAMNDDVQLLLITQLLGCARDQEWTVRESAVSAIGVALSIPDMGSERYMLDLSWSILKACQDDSAAVRCAAVWGLGNVALCIPPPNTKEREEMLAELPLTKLIRVCLDLTKDPPNTKMNCSRTIGALLSLVTEELMENSQYLLLVEESVDFLISAAMNGQFMKVRWNACYALGYILSNKALFSEAPPTPWLERVVESLCSMMVSSRHFKVRAGACAALTAVPERRLYRPERLYSAAWGALLDGLESAAVTPDFTEFRHQRLLNNQLCSGVCKLVCLLSGEEDLNCVSQLVEYREERLTSALGRYLTSDETPDRCGPGVAARQHLLSLPCKDHPMVLLLLSALSPPE